jgi:hypothetical protein
MALFKLNSYLVPTRVAFPELPRYVFEKKRLIADQHIF